MRQQQRLRGLQLDLQALHCSSLSSEVDRLLHNLRLLGPE
jgi:hypothetical protein